jgi:quercetin dioxygenase-like cupin family protein
MVKIKHWESKAPITEEAIRKIFESESLKPTKWSDLPGEKYTPHSHPYLKIIYVVEGSMIFVFTDKNESFKVKAGDRLEVLPGVIHHAMVGPDGITCLEGHEDRETES